MLANISLPSLSVPLAITVGQSYGVAKENCLLFEEPLSETGTCLWVKQVSSLWEECINMWILYLLTVYGPAENELPRPLVVGCSQWICPSSILFQVWFRPNCKLKYIYPDMVFVILCSSYHTGVCSILHFFPFRLNLIRFLMLKNGLESHDWQLNTLFKNCRYISNVSSVVVLTRSFQPSELSYTVRCFHKEMQIHIRVQDDLNLKFFPSLQYRQPPSDRTHLWEIQNSRYSVFRILTPVLL